MCTCLSIMILPVKSLNSMDEMGATMVTTSETHDLETATTDLPVIDGVTTSTATSLPAGKLLILSFRCFLCPLIMISYYNLNYFHFTDPYIGVTV